jgi:hypothetical protein
MNGRGKLDHPFRPSFLPSSQSSSCNPHAKDCQAPSSLCSGCHETCGSPLYSSKLAKRVGREPRVPSYDNDALPPTGGVCIPNRSLTLACCGQHARTSCFVHGGVLLLLCLFEARSLSIALAGWHVGRPRTHYVCQNSERSACLRLPDGLGLEQNWSLCSDRNMANKVCFEAWS